MEVVAQSNSCSVCVYTYRGKGEAQMLYKYCFNILNKPWCGEFSNSCESSWLREQKTDSFQYWNFWYFWKLLLREKGFLFFKWGHLDIQCKWNTQELKTQVGFFDFGVFSVFWLSVLFCLVWGGCCLFCGFSFVWVLVFGFFLMGFQLP